jgi:hypothetical protein
MAPKKKLAAYKKKVKSSKLYAKNAAGRKQKRIDILARKRKLGLGNKKRIQRVINRKTKQRNRILARKKKRAGNKKKK